MTRELWWRRATVSLMALLLVRGSSAFSLPGRQWVRTRRHRTVIRYAEPESPRSTEAMVQNLLKGTFGRAKRTITEKNEFASFSQNQEESVSVDGDDLFSITRNKGSRQSEVTANMLRSTASRAKATLSTSGRDLTPLSSSDETETRSEVAAALLGAMTSRAKRSLSTKTPSDNEEEEASSSLPTATAAEATEILTTTTTPSQEFIPTDLRYNQNPAISLTALAHWLWSSVLRPHEDSAVDATCGHGHDSCGIARILFGNEDLYLHRNSELVCVDVQERACQATEQALLGVLHPSTLDRQVQIVQTSHAPLPTPRNISSVALVVYNLGYLPNSSDKEPAFQTQVESTLESITDALLLIRLGGMVSIMTYPRTNVEEDFAVRALLEAAVAMTNKQGPDCYTFVGELDCSSDLKALLTSELRRMSTFYEQNNLRRTFRVTEHKKIGLAQAPILMTATRIK